MRRILLLIAALLLVVTLRAQTGTVPGHCYLGGTPATTSSLKSANYLQGIIPGCTVTVYLTGTHTLAAISGVASNPFTANTASSVDPGGWIFTAPINQGLDVVLSGGNSNPSCTLAPLCYTTPFTLTGLYPNQAVTGLVPLLTPYADVRNAAYGALCNGTNDDTAAVQAAIAASFGTGGGGVVYIPDGCYIANGSGLSNTSGKQLVIELQGTLKTGSTFVAPLHTALLCQGKGPADQFATGQPTCTIQVAGVYGAIGTAITSTNTAVTITPSFVGGTIANMPVNSAITIAGVMTCTGGSATRTALAGSFPGAGPTNTVFTFTGTPCTDSSGNSLAVRIPPAAQIVISNCSDSTLNGTYFSTVTDFPAQTIGTRQVGSGTTATGCTIVGFNVDSLETVRIESVAGSNVTLRTNHVHASSDLFGMAGFTPTFFDQQPATYKGIAVTGNYGVGFWGDVNFGITFSGVFFTGSQQYLTSFPMELSSTYGFTMPNSQTTSFSGYTCPTVSQPCNAIGPPFDVLMDNVPESLFHSNSVGGGVFGPNSTISHGIYITPAAFTGTGGYATGPVINNSVIEQPMWNGVTFDSRVSTIYQTSIENSLIQDDLVGWSQASWVGMTDIPPFNGNGQGSVSFHNNANIAYGPLNGTEPMSTVNKYFCGQVTVDSQSTFSSLVWPACSEATVTLSDGRSSLGERAGGIFAPSFIPYTTLTTSTTASGWTCTNIGGTGCTVTAGQVDPWGGTNAAALYSGTGFTQIAGVGNYSGITTATGDVYLYSVWTRVQDGFATPTMVLKSFGTDTFDVLSTQFYAPNTTNMSWHPIVGMSIVTAGSASSHTIQFQLSPSVNAVATTASFAQPCVIKIPASAGIPIDEIRMYRTYMLDAFCPSALSSAAYVMNPSFPLCWGTSCMSGPGSGAPYQISYQPGLLTAVGANKGNFSIVSKASTVDNIVGSASLFTCSVNPQVTFYECGTSTTCASPTTIGTVTITAAATAVVGTVSSSAIAAGDYVAWALTAGTCTSLDISVGAQVHTN